MRFKGSFMIGIAFVCALCLLPIRAQDAPDIPGTFGKVKEALGDAKAQSGTPAAQAPLLKTALDTIRMLPPSAKYKGHRGEAIEALQVAIQITNRLAMMSANGAKITMTPSTPGGGDGIDALIDVALKETEAAFAAWNNDDTTMATASASSSSKTVAAPSESEAAALQSVVIIKGDESQGTGFFVRSADGPAIVTNLHVLFSNPNIKISTPGGDEVKTTGLKAASDRDLVLIGIEDKGYKYLDMAANVGKEAQIGDDLVTPGNSKGGEVILPTRGKLLATGSQRVEFDNPIYHGNSGGPVYDLKIKKVIGVVTQAEKVNTGNDIDKASFSSKNSAITGSMRYFGFRIDSVPQWDVYDWPQFLAESKQIDDFHDRTAALHSYLASLSQDKSPSPGGIDRNLYLHDDPVRLANLEFRSQIDRNQNSASARDRAVDQLVITLRNLADAQYDAIDQGRFYAYNAQVAKDEIAYRKQIRDSLDHLSETINH